jgi:ubiquinone/menaquinone biosynthesis C-methylase UbiE
MNIQQSYNLWADQYDSNENKTRDLEGIVLRKILSKISFDNCLEIGCGTGKNTQWLMANGTVTAVDLSEKMLDKAKEKIPSGVHFIQADITAEWAFTTDRYDLVTFSLVLEHIEHLQPVFAKAANVLKPGGYLYIGELHPFKQYAGSKARFDTEEGSQVVQCFNHHLSDFIRAASSTGLAVVSIEEFFDDDNRRTLPRILSISWRKPLRKITSYY